MLHAYLLKKISHPYRPPGSPGWLSRAALIGIRIETSGLDNIHLCGPQYIQAAFACRPAGYSQKHRSYSDLRRLAIL